jgi:hypothetical protein
MLCDICNGLDLAPDNFIIQPDDDAPKFDQYYDIGSLYDIRQRAKNCALCRLVVDANTGPEPASKETEKDVKCQFYWQSDGFIYGVEGPTTRRLRISATPHPPFWPESNSLTVLSDDAANGHQLFLGRTVPETQIDTKLIKKWLRNCQRWHGDECDAPIESSPPAALPPAFRVIDTWTMCIDEVPLGSKYLALSYVWGRIDNFMLTTKNVAELRKPGGLKRVWHGLPTTIRDAITLTSSLARYVWIDSLCILQDDVEDKMKLIPLMDSIYGNGFLTIVAGSGSDANAGLPGIRKGSRDRFQAVEEVMPGFRMMAPKHVFDAVNQSIWESRGWTYVFAREKKLRCIKN